MHHEDGGEDQPGGGSSESATGRRRETSSLFSLAALEMGRTSTGRPDSSDDHSESDTLSDISRLSRSVRSRSTFDNSRKIALDELAWQMDTVLPPVSPLTRERRVGPTVKLAALAVLVSTAIFLSAYTMYRVDDRFEATLSAQRVNDLQTRYDKLLDMLVTAEPASMSVLRARLEQTEKELALLRAAQGRIELRTMPVDNAVQPASSSSPLLQKAQRTVREKKASHKRAPDADPVHVDKTSEEVRETVPEVPTVSKQPPDDLDDLLGIAGQSPKKETGRDLGLDGLFEEPAVRRQHLTRSDVQKGMRKVLSRVKQCGDDKGGSVVMAVTIQRNGRVSQAVATGAYAGSPTGRCVEKAVRTAEFPATKQDITVKYPFRL